MTTKRPVPLLLVGTIILVLQCSEARLPHPSRQLMKPNITTVYYRTDFPSMSPSLDDRIENLFVCAGVQSDTATIETDVEYYLRIETDSSPEVLSWVSSESMKLLVNSICEQEDIEESCILSISSGTKDQRIVSCEPEVETSKSCTWYRGSKRIVHTDTCSSDDVKTEVVNTLKNVTVDDVSLVLNLDGQVVITDIEFAYAPPLSKEVTEKSVESGRKVLTSSGTFITTITALTLLGLLLILLGLRRLRKFRMNKVSFEDGVIRGKDVKSSDSFEPNWRDLAAKHPRMDCRQCNSQTCLECRKQKQDVKMLQFKRNGTFDSIIRMREIVQTEKIANNPKLREAYENTDHNSDDFRSASVSNSIINDTANLNRDAPKEKPERTSPNGKRLLSDDEFQISRTDAQENIRGAEKRGTTTFESIASYFGERRQRKNTESNDVASVTEGVATDNGRNEQKTVAADTYKSILL